MRIKLINPLVPYSMLGGDFYFRLPTLGLLKVAALTPPEHSVDIVDEKVETLDLDEPVDLVGITAMTPAAYRAYALADHYRSRVFPSSWAECTRPSAPRRRSRTATRSFRARRKASGPRFCATRPKAGSRRHTGRTGSPPWIISRS